MNTLRQVFQYALFFATPTPGAPNALGSPGVVSDTKFSVDRGFHDEAFSLAIISETPGATIRYTLDDSLPSLSNGQTYSAPLTINDTTNVRAIAYLDAQSFIPTNVDTHTYLFVDRVAEKSSTPPGWATDWGFDSQVGRVIPSDYEMDPRVVNDVLSLRSPGYSMREALLDIPSVSITMKQSDFVKAENEKTGGDTRSIYGTPRERFEKICSFEYLLPDGTPGFQEDCKIEAHGNSSRTPTRMQKHSMRLTFSSEVGVGKLRYNLFTDSPVDQFNKLVLRACLTDSWALASWSSARYRPNDLLYMRDVWMKETFGAMGQQTSYGNFGHVYVNGVYFGLHNLTERIEDDFYADHVGGEKEAWEVNSDLAGRRPAGEGHIIKLTSTGPVKSRVLNASEWSALRSTDFIVGTAAAAGNLVISEIMYHPQGDDGNLEFIELLNISPNRSVDLTGVAFREGIIYEFPAATTIPPLGRIVVAGDRAAFVAVYGEIGIALAPNSFTGSLSNSGETLTLSGNDGAVILQAFLTSDGTTNRRNHTHKPSLFNQVSKLESHLNMVEIVP